jgi:peptidoglycan LD-endopeptidase CwlK
MDAISEQRLQAVCPALADKIHALAAAMPNVDLRVTQGLRLWSEQAALYAQGRTTLGVIVTDAPPGYSYHEFGLAVDVVPMDQDPPQPDWDLSHPVWQQIVTAGEALGLFSGSEFCTIKDWPHFQMTGTFPDSPTDEVRELYSGAGIQAVWRASGIWQGYSVPAPQTSL